MMRIKDILYARDGGFFRNNTYYRGDIHIEGGMLEFNGKSTNKYPIKMEEVLIVSKQGGATCKWKIFYISGFIFLIFLVLMNTFSFFDSGYISIFFSSIVSIFGYRGYKNALGPWIKITGTRKSGLKVDVFIRRDGVLGAFGETQRIFERLEIYMHVYRSQQLKLVQHEAKNRAKLGISGTQADKSVLNTESGSNEEGLMEICFDKSVCKRIIELTVNEINQERTFPEVIFSNTSHNRFLLISTSSAVFTQDQVVMFVDFMREIGRNVFYLIPYECVMDGEKFSGQYYQEAKDYEHFKGIWRATISDSWSHIEDVWFDEGIYIDYYFLYIEDTDIVLYSSYLRQVVVFNIPPHLCSLFYSIFQTEIATKIQDLEDQDVTDGFPKKGEIEMVFTNYPGTCK
ncbi:MAG: hypothetical protein ACK5QE_03495 [Sphingobacteriia bacterium]